ncbi:hypothetical protein GCM10011492_44620 [Flexivirga endophytica]|uniref:Uncharacterized protein n=1 Tax=Flexivirga endophytica TaxID=1849103 RepID=A0A916TK94_9MICO|nr:hypothetical protein [Flexivirga endophytica]GGB48435.1 hypothetical protein GCM10011492_44620 [Flexivirga endophytica]GHB71419.1 hypothetical protein GCM10008112_44630 [Flexivirga endophytica]
MSDRGTLLRVVPALTALATSTVLVVIVGAVLPGVIALPVFVVGVVVMAVLLSGRAEATAAQVLAGAREPLGYEVASLKPVFAVLREHHVAGDVDVRVSDSGRVYATRFGRHTLVVSAGLMRAVRAGGAFDERAAAIIAHALGLGVRRFEAAVAFWTLPWKTMRAVCRAAVALLSVQPLLSLAWRLRFVTATAAAVQGITEGHPVFDLLTAGIVVVTYLVPWCERREQLLLQRQGDRFVIEHGFGTCLAEVLRPSARAPKALQRVHALQVGGQRRELTLAPTGAAS